MVNFLLCLTYKLNIYVHNSLYTYICNIHKQCVYTCILCIFNKYYVYMPYIPCMCIYNVHILYIILCYIFFIYISIIHALYVHTEHTHIYSHIYDNICKARHYLGFHTVIAGWGLKWISQG